MNGSRVRLIRPDIIVTVVFSVWGDMAVVCALMLAVFIIFVVVAFLVFAVLVLVATVISAAVLLFPLANSLFTPFATLGSFWHLLLAFCASSQQFGHEHFQSYWLTHCLRGNDF